MELEKRLGLYQVFVKIYEHNRSLLDEILQLETSTSLIMRGKSPPYVQGMLQGQQAYLVTNLVNGKTQRLYQPQKIWVMGRDRRLTLSLKDQWMSRRHAAIQYITNEGFYLVDLNSTNGSFVNGEPVHQRLLLQDGDLIRLGSLAIYFFLGQSSQTLESVSPEILAQIEAMQVKSPPSAFKQKLASIAEDELISEIPEDTSVVMSQRIPSEEPTSPTSLPQLSISQRSEILDRFLSSRHAPEKGN